MAIPALIAGGGALLGGVLAGNSARSVAQAQAAAQLETARLAAEEARFRPVGVTTRFGASNFTTGADGRVSGAGYELSPEFKAYQDRLMGLTGSALTSAEGGAAAAAPLGNAAQGLFTLGQGYLAETPQDAAKRFMAQQQDLLAPSRERQLSQVQNSLFNTGRGGLAVGATGMRPGGGAGLGAASPEMEAYFNAIAQQDARLATEATKGGMDQARFGAGLFATGGNLLTQGYGAEAAALGPYETYLAQMKQLEALGQDPLNIGINIGAKGQSPTGANALYGGGMAAAGSNAAANAYNPFATALTGASQNRTFTDALGRLFNNDGRAALSQTGFGGSGFGTGLAYGNQDLGAFL